MDGLFIAVLALILVLKSKPVETEAPDMVRETRLNPNFYEDENAFMEIANELGFH